MVTLFKNTKIYSLLFIFIVKGSYLHSMEVYKKDVEKVVEYWNENERNEYAYIDPKCSEKLYFSEDFSGVLIGNNSSYTYFNPGLAGVNVAAHFGGLCKEKNKPFGFRYFKQDEYQYPGKFVISNGVVNNQIIEDFLPHMCQSGVDGFNMSRSAATNMFSNKNCAKIVAIKNAFSNAFSYEREAIVNLFFLNYLLEKGVPVETFQTICYGFQGLICMLHALTSDSERAQQLRESAFIDKDRRKVLLDKIKLIIVQAPLMSALNPIECTATSLADTAVCGVGASVGLVGCGALSWGARNNNDFIPAIKSLAFAVGIYGSRIVSTDFLRNLFVNVGINYVLPRISSIDEKNGDMRMLLYDLKKSNKQLQHIKLFMTWQKKDPIVQDIKCKDMNLLSEIFDFSCVGSPYSNHEQEDKRQRYIENFFRFKTQAPYSMVGMVLKLGAKYWNEIEQFHLEKDWEGLKAYTEAPEYYPYLNQEMK